MADIFMLVRQGRVQRFQDVRIGDRTGMIWPVARTHDDAVKLLDTLSDATDVRVARIGSIDGETVAGHIQLAIEERLFRGCRCSGLE